MVTPLYDIDVGTLYEMALRLEVAVVRTLEDMGWEGGSMEVDPALEMQVAESMVISSAFCSQVTSGATAHTIRACRTCASNVCENVRTHFMQVC